jgi:hypothetical protein
MSYFLFVAPSVLYGAARTLDLFALFDDYNTSLTPAQADWLALQDDAAHVYQDFWEAYETETATAKPPGAAEFENSPTEELSLAR